MNNDNGGEYATLSPLSVKMGESVQGRPRFHIRLLSTEALLNRVLIVSLTSCIQAAAPPGPWAVRLPINAPVVPKQQGLLLSQCFAKMIL